METIITLNPPYQAEMLERMRRMYEQSIGDTALNEKWFRTDTRDFKRSMRTPGATCCVQLIGQEIAGFAQGYSVSAHEELSGWLGGLKIHSVLRGEYFFIERIAVCPAQKQDVGKELVRRMLSSHSCKQTLVWVRNDSEEFELIIRCGGEKFWSTRRIGWIMGIPR